MGRQLPGDTCSPRDASEDRAGRQLCSGGLRKARLVSMVLLDVTINPLGLEKFWVFLQKFWVFHAGAEVVWCEDAEQPRGPHRQGTELDNLPSHRRAG